MVEKSTFIVIDTTSRDFPAELRKRLRYEYEDLYCIGDGGLYPYSSEWEDNDGTWDYTPERSRMSFEDSKNNDGHFGTFEQYESDELYTTDHKIYDFLVSQGWDKEPVRILLK